MQNSMTLRAAIDEIQRDLWLSDIYSIPTADALRVWGQRQAKDLAESPYVDEIRKAYTEKLKRLEGGAG